MPHNKEVLYLPRAAIKQMIARFHTPFFLYDEKRIRANCRIFRNSFRRYFPSFAPLYAVKANTNPFLLNIIFSEGFGADASSEAEAWITHKLNGSGMYTGNYTTENEFKFVLKTGCFKLNLDDASMIPTIKKIGIPEFISFRVNPGLSHGGMKSLYLAGPNAKFGVPLKDIITAYKNAKELGVKRFGIHTMTGSNILNESYFETIAVKLLQIAGKIKKKLGIDFECLNIGGGFGVPYRPEERSLDLEQIARRIRSQFTLLCPKYGLKEPILMAEPGRFIMANAGWLIGKVHVIKNSYKQFIGIDAGMNDLPRPAIYNAYHHITVLNQKQGRKRKKVNIVGRLCENNDQFAVDRLLPEIRVGDFIVIHNAGAHAYAMAHNYNNRLRSPEYLITKNGALKQIRRAETFSDLFKTTRIERK